MSTIALFNLIDQIRGSLNQQDSSLSREDYINSIINNKAYYIINLRYPNTVNETLLRNIAEILIDNRTADPKIVLELAQNIVYIAKTIVTEQRSIDGNDDNNSNNTYSKGDHIMTMYDLFYDLMLHVLVTIDGTLFLENEPGDNNISAIIDHSVKKNNKSSIKIDFLSLLYNLIEVDTYSKTKYKKFNNLIGRIGLEEGSINIPSGYVKVLDKKRIYTSRTFLRVDPKDFYIPSLTGGVVKKLYDDSPESFRNKLNGLLLHISDLKIININYLYPLFERSLLPFIILKDQSIVIDKETKVIALSGNNSGGVTTIIDRCEHYSQLEELSTSDFEKNYIYYDSHQAYCRVCSERIASFDMVVNLLDKTYSKDIKLYLNLKIFDSNPYKEYYSCLTYIIEKNNRLQESLKIRLHDYLYSICQNYLDILLKHNNSKSSITRKYMSNIRENNVFFPRLTNQLFILDIYEKEQYAEEKYLNMVVIYILVIIFLVPNFILLVINNQRSLFIKRKVLVIPSIEELVVSILSRSKLLDISQLAKVPFLVSFYQQDDLLTDVMIDLKNRFHSSYRILTPEMFEELVILDTVSFPLDDYYNKVIETSNSRTDSDWYREINCNTKVDIIINRKPVMNITSSVPRSLSDINMKTPKIKLRPQITIPQAKQLIKSLVPKMTYKYSYQPNPNDNKITELTYYKVKNSEEIIDSKNNIINVYTNPRLKIITNEYYRYLLSNEPLPSVNEITDQRYDRFLMYNNLDISSQGYDITTIDSDYIEEIVTPHRENNIQFLMLVSVLYKSSIGYSVSK